MNFLVMIRDRWQLLDEDRRYMVGIVEVVEVLDTDARSEAMASMREEGWTPLEIADKLGAHPVVVRHVNSGRVETVAAHRLRKPWQDLGNWFAWAGVAVIGLGLAGGVLVLILEALGRGP